MNIAMWSGPRNLSTALMYAFAQRADTAVWDEPFYAAYLRRTGLPHPMAAEVIAAGETDPAAVARRCAAPSGDAPHIYQKHMAQHMIDGFDLSFMDRVTNAFLIRHPARVLASYHAKREDPTEADIGARRLRDLFERARRASDAIVIDGDDIRRAPRAALHRLCDALGLAFEDRMLRWPEGGNAADGVWAAYWYGAVHASTGLRASDPGPLPDLPRRLRPALEEAMPHYDAMRAHALRVPHAQTETAT